MQKPAPPSNKKRCSCVCAISRHEFYIRYQYSQQQHAFSAPLHILYAVWASFYIILCTCIQRAYIASSVVYAYTLKPLFSSVFFAARKKFIYEIINPRAGKSAFVFVASFPFGWTPGALYTPTQTPATLFPSWCWYFIPARASKTLFANKMSSRNVNN